MKKNYRHKSSLDVSQDESGVAGLISKMQRQLNAMEEKLDILIGQSSKRFSQSNRQDRGRQGSDFREKTYTRAICEGCKKECEVPFKPSGDRPVYCKDCFSKRKRENR